jgi:anti-sigma factor RsiW
MKPESETELLSAAIRRQAQRYPAPRALKDRVRSMVREERRERPPAAFLAWLKPANWPGMAGWQTLGTAFSVIALVTAVSLQPASQLGGDERLMEAAVATHMQASAGPHLVDVRSSERDTVQPWLRERLAFTAPVGLPRSAGVELVGARTDTLDGRSVAAVVYRLRDHVVHAFIWPVDSGSTAVRTASVDGFSVSRWTRGGLRYCVVSDLPAPQQVAFAESLAEVDDAR